MSADPYRLRKHSLMIAGHETSVTLEDAFWERLKAIAATHGTSVNGIVAEIDRTRQGNLSSAIRVFILETFARQGSQTTLEEPE